MTEQLEVAQADRDAAADLQRDPFIRRGYYDKSLLVQTLARHRLQTEARMSAAVEAERERCVRIAARALEKLDEPTQALIVSDAIRSQSNA